MECFGLAASFEGGLNHVAIKIFLKCLISVGSAEMKVLTTMLEGLLSSGRASDLQRNCLRISDRYFSSPAAQLFGALKVTLAFARGYSR